LEEGAWALGNSVTEELTGRLERRDIVGGLAMGSQGWAAYERHLLPSLHW
jgi:hypothetical protein